MFREKKNFGSHKYIIVYLIKNIWDMTLFALLLSMESAEKKKKWEDNHDPFDIRCATQHSASYKEPARKKNMTESVFHPFDIIEYHVKLYCEM